ncbi:hypothetical protein FNV43_RR11314 [Rhamnella rubrinervis]|uniref:Uncharacterized protein n=1 Tax=Rhamnella rubrinervis TaxID=2594499 RepID=A0A8K0MHR4_9ROSA|nr:hypothetical protein FNV43_RR11314 [Rhamnella rubrinervis]
MMQGRPSKLEIKDMDEIDKLNKLKEEPHLSGAYIRSLVKQLTSSKTKDSMMNPKDHLDSSTTTTSVVSESVPAQNLTITKFGKGLDETQHTKQTQQQQQQHKKQVRRRLHTPRPYQERLLNMAEARREIVTALKFHRAAMKQASDQQHQQHQQQEQSPTVQPPSHPHHVEQQGRMKSRRNPRIYPSTTTSNFSNNFLDNFSYPHTFSHHHPAPNPFAWPASPITTLPFAENLNFSLPNQTLGLNLNFHDFNNIDTSRLYHNNNNNPSFHSTSTTSNSVSSPSSSSSPTLSTAVDQELVPVGPPAVVADHHGFEPCATTSGGRGGLGGLHAAMDDEEMAEIRSIGEQHQMEWNDTMNLVTSAWWFKFLKTMELGGGPDDHMKGGDDDIDGYHPFDQVMEFPAWLSANDSDGCFQQHFDNYCPQDYIQNLALPW